ncbi:MAG: ECF-type sigma factor [Acidobacteriota bacterium]
MIRPDSAGESTPPGVDPDTDTDVDEPSAERTSEVTALLQRWRGGDSEAFDRLMPIVYRELQHVARNHMRSEDGSTLQATALVHEAYLRLLQMDVDWQGRVHLFAVAAGAMRRILVDRARRRRAEKRGGEARDVELGEVADLLVGEGLGADELLALDETLRDLAELDTRKAKVLELRLFGGLTIQETAEALDISTATVERELRMARAWAARRLRGDAP